MSTETLEETGVDVVEQYTEKLVVYNDDVNNFQYVILTLIEVCEHRPEQAEQCALIIHNNGSCVVKEGDISELSLMCKSLLTAELTAKLE